MQASAMQASSPAYTPVLVGLKSDGVPRHGVTGIEGLVTAQYRQHTVANALTQTGSWHPSLLHSK